MAAEPQNSPKIREPESGSQNFGFCSEPCHVPVSELNPGIRRVSLRAEIDTSPPFGSVKEAVTRFGGSGPWVPLYKFAEAYKGIEEFDLKKMEEQTAELEKNLIVKELETLDVLEELGTTKKIVEELKRQLQSEAMKCMNSNSTDLDLDSDAAVKVMNNEHYEQQMRIGCSVSSHDSILMELKQAKLNLGKTINDLGVIQASVECLNKKMEKEKCLLEKTRERLTYKPEQFKQMVDEHNKPCISAVEMRLIAAKKMEEAAKAAKALAVIEMKGLSSNANNSSGFCLPEPSPRTPNAQRAEANISKLSILRKMEEASMEVKHGKKALEEALNRIEIANRKQFDAEEALRRWIPSDQEQRKHVVYNATKINNSPLPHSTPHPHHHQHIARSPLHDLNERNTTMDDDDEQNPVLRTTVSMGDILRTKQVPSTKGQKVALSQMLHELREDHQLAFSPKPDKKDQQKQYLSQRRKFGFIHISLPLPKQNKKKSQALNSM